MSAASFVVEGRVVPVEWNSSATAQDLLSQIPLELTFEDYAGQEKLAPLPRPLSLEGAPSASGAEVGEVAYYAPNKVIVVYYEATGRFPGIVPIGRISAEDTAFFRAQKSAFAARLQN